MPINFINDSLPWPESGSTPLTSHTPDTGGSWVWGKDASDAAIYAGTGLISPSATQGYYYVTTSPPSADYEVSCDLYISDNSNPRGGVALRFDTSTGDCYTFFLYNGTWYLRFNTTDLDTAVSGTFTNGHTITATIAANGSTISGSVSDNGSAFTEVVSAVDTTLSDAGKAAITIMSGGASPIVHYWALTNVVGQPTTRRFGQTTRGMGRRRPGVFISRSQLPQAA